MNLSLVLVYIESWDGIMARMRRMDRTRGKDGDVSLCFRLGRKKDTKARKEKQQRKDKKQCGQTFK